MGRRASVRGPGSANAHRPSLGRRRETCRRPERLEGWPVDRGVAARRRDPEDRRDERRRRLPRARRPPRSPATAHATRLRALRRGGRPCAATPRRRDRARVGDEGDGVGRETRSIRWKRRDVIVGHSTTTSATAVGIVRCGRHRTGGACGGARRGRRGARPRRQSHPRRVEHRAGRAPVAGLREGGRKMARRVRSLRRLRGGPLARPVGRALVPGRTRAGGRGWVRVAGRHPRRGGCTEVGRGGCGVGGSDRVGRRARVSRRGLFG